MRSGVFSLAGARSRLALSAFLAVTAMVVGLFAMHTMAGHAPHVAAGGAASTGAAAGHGHEVTGMHGISAGAGVTQHDGATHAVVCDEACQMGGLMIGLICTVALLAVLVGFRLRPPVVPSMWEQTRRIGRTRPARLAPPTPPSLTALSISRT